MLAARREHARPGRYPLLHLSVLMMLTSTLSVAAQNAAPGQAAPTSRRLILPQSCLEQSHSSEKITALLESVHDHPTAGAYNTLGVLYAQSDHVSCAIAAFEAALQLE